jgi:Lon protease-like protein
MSISPTVTIPATMPVMVLSGCTLFPHSLMPLYIFEHRYREMLAHALENHRMFCIGHLNEDADIELDQQIRTFTTAGVVRACVGHPDGTSHLMLQGVSRVRIVGWDQREPFRIARLEPVQTIAGNIQENLLISEHLMKVVLRLLEGGGEGAEQMGQQLRGLKNPDVLADFIAANFLSDPNDRQQALELLDVGPRLKFLAERLQ